MFEAKVGDITKENIDAIVSAANGIGVMGKGVAGAIASAAGQSVTEEARLQYKLNIKPFDEGTSYETSAGNLEQNGVKKIFHAVTMKYPGGFSSIYDIENAMVSVLERAVSLGIKSIAFPGLGTGIGGLRPETVAIVMSRTARQYENKINIKIIDKNSFFINNVLKYFKVPSHKE